MTTVFLYKIEFILKIIELADFSTQLNKVQTKFNKVQTKFKKKLSIMPVSISNESVKRSARKIKRAKERFVQDREDEADGSEYIYTEQRAEAARIFEAFITAFIVTFVAPMQWGKTGVFLETAYKMVEPDESTGLCRIHPDNVYIITGMSGNDWREQTKRRAPEQWRKNILHRSNLKKIDEKMKVITNALIVIDECHFGTSSNTVLDTKLQEWFGLPSVDALKERNIRILQTSATPDNVIVSAEQWSESGDSSHNWHQTITPHEISGSYTGIHTFDEEGRMFESLDLSDPENVITLNSAIKSFTSFKNHVIRLPSNTKKQFKIIENIQRMVDHNGYDITHHYSTSEDKIEDLDIFFESAPENTHRIILIKNYWRAAQTMADTHIGVVHEYKAEETSDTTESQGLVGRLCGYNRTRGDQAPKVYCTISSAYKYDHLRRCGFDYKNPTVEYHSAGIDKKENQEPTLRKGTFFGESCKEEKPDLQNVTFSTIADAKRWVAANIKPKPGSKRPQPNLPTEDEHGFRCIKMKGVQAAPMTLEECTEVIESRYSKQGHLKGRLAFPYYTDPETPETLRIVVFYHEDLIY